MSRQKHTCVMMGTKGRDLTPEGMRSMRGDPAGASQGQRKCLKGDREFWPQGPIDESLPEWFTVTFWTQPKIQAGR
jgi:hypothetical protein